jgi:hypothetical protein
VVHKGARHVALRDGLWLQPEPLLYLGLTNGNLASPIGYTGVYAAGDTNQLGDPSGRFPALAAAPPLAIGAGTVIAAGAGAVVAGGMLYAIYDPQGAAAAVAAVGDAGAAALTTLSNSVSDAQQLTGQPTPANTRGFDWAASPQLSASKSVDTSWFPDRALPRDANGVPIPDSQYPHTQLGTKEGSKGSYGQAREFGEGGKPVKDIDFTDHGRKDHPSPHEHKYLENETGGTPKRGPTEPLETPE